MLPVDLGEVSLVDRLQRLVLVGAGHQEEVPVDRRLRAGANSIKMLQIVRKITHFFKTQPLLVLLQRLSDSAHRRIIGPQVESTPALGRAVQHWPTAVERLCSVLTRLSPWSQLGRLL